MLNRKTRPHPPYLYLAKNLLSSSGGRKSPMWWPPLPAEVSSVAFSFVFSISLARALCSHVPPF